MRLLELITGTGATFFCVRRTQNLGATENPARRIVLILTYSISLSLFERFWWDLEV